MQKRCLQVSMTQRNYIIVLVSLLLTTSTFGQIKSPTKKELLKTFKQSVQQNKKIHTISNSWVVCNKDSSFYNSDTIQLVNNENYYYHSDDCCYFVDWTFYSKDKFVQTKIDICKEPTSTSVTNANDNYNVSLTNTGQDLVMTTANSINLTQRYKVLSIGKIKIGTEENLTVVITLLRLK